ncbi:MAG: threonylcarbamoyl-AMP synthase [Sedimentisphaerales bacterium]|nr:threonylcarbamoyl-AMP synthase [Sedimentisphaerales bacterium]
MQTEIIKVATNNIDFDRIRQAAELVDSAQLVVFPTETVYGIACACLSRSLAELSRIKGIRDEKRYTLHIEQKNDICKYVPTIVLRQQKLIKNAWPGPVTIVFELSASDLNKQRSCMDKETFEQLYKNSSIGIRCPDNPVASLLLKMTQNHLFAPSANLTGQNPAIDAQQALDQLSGRVRLIIDGGATKYKKSSTVVKIGKMGLEVLRPGVYSKSALEMMSQINFLIVCTGNTCRSPMAAAIFGSHLAKKLGCKVDHLEEKGYKVSSAGTMGLTDLPPSKEAMQACAAMGIDMAGHRSRSLTRQLVQQSDFIFVMENVHCQRIGQFGDEAMKKCVLLAENNQIPDPIGQSQQVFNNCAKLIEKAVIKRIGELSI